MEFDHLLVLAFVTIAAAFIVIKRRQKKRFYEENPADPSIPDTVDPTTEPNKDE